MVYLASPYGGQGITLLTTARGRLSSALRTEFLLYYDGDARWGIGWIFDVCCISVYPCLDNISYCRHLYPILCNHGYPGYPPAIDSIYSISIYKKSKKEERQI